MKLMGSSIQEMYNKFKSLLANDVFFYTALLLGIAVVSFGLGRWSMAVKNQQSSVPMAVTLEQRPNVTETTTSKPQEGQTQASSTKQQSIIAPVSTTSARYVGSRSGTKYHLLTCPGAKQIKESNKIFFTTKEDAQKAGYTPAGNCKGI